MILYRTQLYITVIPLYMLMQRSQCKYSCLRTSSQSDKISDMSNTRILAHPFDLKFLPFLKFDLLAFWYSSIQAKTNITVNFVIWNLGGGEHLFCLTIGQAHIHTCTYTSFHNFHASSKYIFCVQTCICFILISMIYLIHAFNI